MPKILKLILAGLLLLTPAALVVMVMVVPPMIDRSVNEVGIAPPYRVTEAASNLHRRLTIVDLHADSVIWGRDLLRRNSARGQIDLPRLGDANVAVQVFSVPTQVPRTMSQWGTRPDSLNLITLLAVSQLWPPSTWASLNGRTLYLSQRLDGIAEESAGRLRLLRTASELSAHLEQRQPGQTAGILAIEGLHALEGKLENLEKLYQAGYRMMGLVHQFDNRLGGSSYGMERGGLTQFGKQVVRRMEELGIAVDLAHASPQLLDEVLDIATRPVVVSHTGVRGTCDRRRNISDDHVRRIAATGGVIGIGFWSGATCGEGAGAIARAMRYVSDLVGVDHAALGSDFDGEAMPFDVTGLPLITEALITEGFSEEEIGRIMGGNTLRVLSRTLPK